MPAFRFRGVAQASVFALTLAQGAGSVNSSGTWGGEAPPVEPGGTGQVTINVRYLGINVAPDPVQVSTTLAGFPDQQPTNPLAVDPTYAYYYIWNGYVGDSTARYFLNAPHLTGAPVDRRFQTGPNPTFVYDEAITPTVGVFVVSEDGSVWGSAQVTLNAVQTPEQAWQGAGQTIIIDPLGVGDAATYPNASVVTTWSAALQLYRYLDSTGQILIPYGQTTERSGTNFREAHNWYVGVWGDPTDGPAYLSPGATFNRANSTYTSMIWNRVHWLGNWNGFTEEYEGGDPIGSSLSQAQAGISLLFYRTHHENTYAMVGLGTFMTRDFVAYDCKLASYKGVGLTGRMTESVSLIGSDIGQNPDFKRGGGQQYDGTYSVGNNNGGGTYRCESPKSHFYASRFNLANGWTLHISGGVFISEQPMFRWNNDGIIGEKGYMGSCMLEAGVLFGTGRAIDGTLVLERNLFVYGAGGVSSRPCFPDVEHLTVRSNLMIFPDAEAYSPTQFPDTMFELQDILTGPKRFYNNTMVDLRTFPGPTTVVSTRGRTYPGFVDNNNIVHEPNKAGGVLAFSPVSLTQVTGLPVRYKFPPARFDVYSVGITDPGAVDQQIASGTSILMPYPPGGAFGDYVIPGAHQVRVNALEGLPNNSLRFSPPFPGFTFSFEAGGVRVHNNSGYTATMGRSILKLERIDGVNVYPTTGEATPVDTPLLARPATGSSAIEAAITGYKHLYDYAGSMTPAHPLYVGARTAPTLGAMEPA